MKQLLPAEYFAAVLAKEQEQVEFFGREFNEFVSYFHLTLLRKDLDFSDGDRGIFPCGREQLGAAQYGLDTRDQLLRAEGLGHVVIRTVVESCNFVGKIMHGGEHNNRNQVILGAKPAADLETVHLGQHQIKNNKVRSIFLDCTEYGFSIIDTVNIIANQFKVEFNEHRNRRFVVNDKNFFSSTFESLLFMCT